MKEGLLLSIPDGEGWNGKRGRDFELCGGVMKKKSSLPDHAQAHGNFTEAETGKITVEAAGG